MARVSLEEELLHRVAKIGAEFMELLEAVAEGRTDRLPTGAFEDLPSARREGPLFRVQFGSPDESGHWEIKITTENRSYVLEVAGSSTSISPEVVELAGRIMEEVRKDVMHDVSRLRSTLRAYVGAGLPIGLLEDELNNAVASSVMES